MLRWHKVYLQNSDYVIEHLLLFDYRSLGIVVREPEYSGDTANLWYSVHSLVKRRLPFSDSHEAKEFALTLVDPIMLLYYVAESEP
jgi:hypothetical protein